MAKTYLWSTGETTPTITVNPTEPTVYTLTVTDETGNVATNSILVTPKAVPPTPPTPPTPEPTEYPSDIKRYLPVALRLNGTVIDIADVENPVLQAFRNECRQVKNEAFVGTATEEGLEKFEAYYNLTGNSSLDLEERRTKVLFAMAKKNKYTMQILRELVSTILPDSKYTISVDPTTETMNVLLKQGCIKYSDDIYELLDRVVPANIALSMSQRYNTWDIASKLTWGEASFISWKQILEEEI